MSKKLYNTFPKDEILKLYIEERMPLSKIAIKFGVTHKTMKRFFEENDITIKGRISTNKWLADKNWLMEQYVENGKSVQGIATIAKTTRGNVYSALKWANIPIRSISEGIKTSYPNRFGPNAGHWKGGRRGAGANQRYYNIQAPGHPNADVDGYVLEHRLVMEKQLGRYLVKGEIVHHLDGNGHNNDISNLQLTTRKKHFTDHFDAVKEVSRLKTILDEHNIQY